MIIEKDDEYYCQACDYFVLITSDEEEASPARVIIDIKSTGSLTYLTSDFPTLSSVKALHRHCYYYNVTQELSSDNLIILTSIFYGTAEVQINAKSFAPSESPNWKKYTLGADNTFKFTPDQLWKNSEGKTSGTVYVCIKSVVDSSYMLRIMLESQSEKYQNFNFLVNSVHTNGFLPAGKATKYRAVDFSKSENITVGMTKKNGNPKLYGYICEDMRSCYFNKEIIQDLCNFQYKKSI